MIIYSNTTPFIALSSIDQLDMQSQGIYYNTALIQRIAQQLGE